MNKKRFLIPLILFLSLLININILGDDEDLAFHFVKKRKDTYVLKVKNKSNFVPITIKVELELENMKSSVRSPITVVINPNEKKELTVISVKDKNGEYDYSYEYLYTEGDIKAKHNKSYVYTLPIKKGNSVFVTQGYNSKFSHNGEYSYSIDFDLEEGTPIYASREGIVAGVMQKFTEGGLDQKLEEKANYVSILHDDGTFGDYVHIKHKGAVVKVGDKVNVGDLIAYSGNVGYSDGPHLHFHVQRPKNFSEMETFPTLFKTKKNPKVRLQEEETYTRP